MRFFTVPVIFISVCLGLLGFSTQQEAPIDPTARCQPPNEQEEILYSDDFHWNYSLPEMQARFDEIYSSGKRLKDRAFYDEASESYVMPMDRAGNGPVRVPKRLIESVRKHIETALER